MRQKNRFLKKHGGLILGSALTLALVALAMLAVAGISRDSRAEQAAQLKSAIIRAAVVSYATEGAYPATLTDIETRYGVFVDTQHFAVTYELLGSNVMPMVEVTEKGVE